MKKLLLLLFVICCNQLLMAQSSAATDSLTIYTGKYKFPSGSVVTEIAVSVTNNVLYATSEIGNSELRHNNGDVFDVIAYDGTATFKRSPEGKVNGVRVEVDDLVLDGSKVEDQLQAGFSLQASTCLQWITVNRS